jgi:hypothetical protein
MPVFRPEYDCFPCEYDNLMAKILEKESLKVLKFTDLPVVLYGCETWSRTLR